MKTKPVNQDRLPELIITAMSMVSIIVIFFIFVFIFLKAWPVVSESGFKLITQGGFDQQIQEAFYATDEAPILSFGMLGLIVSTLLSTGIAIVFATLIGIGASVAIVEFSNHTWGYILTNLVRLLAAIPSVVFGLIGLIVVVPWIEKLFVTVDLQIEYLAYFQMTGKNLLSSVIVLTFMIVPTIVSISVDAIKAVPKSYKEAGFAFGMSHVRVIFRIILPTAKSGILSSVILGAGRGVGEAIAVSMVCGGIGILPNPSFGLYNFLAPVLPLSSAIVNKAEAMGASSVESALFTAALMLLLLGTGLSFLASYVEKRMQGVIKNG